MPRQPRFWYPGAVLHVVQRGNNRAPVFCNNGDRFRYLEWLLSAARAHGVAVHAYVLMTNHVHLLATGATDNAMPCMMQSLGRRYVGWFNHVHGRTGTLWEGRYKATLVDTESYFLACMRYIELNPVRAHMVTAAPDYRWSSHLANAFGTANPLITPHALYVGMGSCNQARCEAYRNWCGRVSDDEELRNIRDAIRFEWVLGSAAYCRFVEAQGLRRTRRLPMGRPHSTAKVVSDPT
jgi:putative transposase